MCIVCGITLCRTYPVCIMACRAWRLLALDMFFMFLKALVIKYAVSVMTFIAKGIGIRTLCCVILRCIIPLKQIFVVRPMRTLRTQSVVITMAVCAEYLACGCIWWKKTRDIRINSCGYHWMI